MVEARSFKRKLALGLSRKGTSVREDNILSMSLTRSAAAG